MIDGTQVIHTPDAVLGDYYYMPLNSCTFAADLSGTGYIRDLTGEVPEFEFTLYGVAVVKSRPFEPKYKFEWELNLNEYDKNQLTAIIAEHRYRISKRQPDWHLRVIDKRILLVDTVNTTRVFSELYSSPHPDVYHGAGHFDIGINTYTYEWLFDDMYRIKMSATEL